MRDGREGGKCVRADAISALPAGQVKALIHPVSDSIQSSMPAFGKKKAVKKTGGGLIVLGVIGIAACLLAMAMVMMNMA